MLTLAGTHDIKDIVAFANEIQNEKQLYLDVPLDHEHFAFWLLNCVQNSGTEVLISRTQNKDGINEVDGFLILTECLYPWNPSIVYGTDIMFLCKRNGLKLVNLAKRIAKKRNWHSLTLSTSCDNERADKFMNKIGHQIGGVYHVG
jgi:hypothetical protein